MSTAGANFTKAQWLAAFAELSAKLTHHNMLVAVEGCEMLKRLLLTQVSITALLQEGDLLQTLLAVFVGGIRCNSADVAAAESPLQSPTVALSEELSWSQLEVLSLCVSLMSSQFAALASASASWSSPATANASPSTGSGSSSADRRLGEGFYGAYFCLMVLARAGEMVGELLVVLQRCPVYLYGSVARVLEMLLALPLGGGGALAAAHWNDASAPDSPGALGASSVALRRHVHELRALVQAHGLLLQDADDALAGLIATTSGPRRLAALRLQGLVHRRLRVYKRRHRSGRDFDTTAEREAYRGGLNRSALSGMTGVDAVRDPLSSRVHAETTGDSSGFVSLNDINQTASSAAESSGPAGATLAELDVTLPEETDACEKEQAPRPQTSDDREMSVSAQRPTAEAAGSDGTGASTHAPLQTHSAELPHESTAAATDDAAQTATGVGGAADQRDAWACGDRVPEALLRAGLRAITQCRSHEDFFRALDDLWSLTVADRWRLCECFDSETVLLPLRRFLVTPPATRADRVLFTSLLQWVDHLLSSAHAALPPATREGLSNLAGTTLLAMLRSELSRPSAGASAADASAPRQSRRAAPVSLSTHDKAVATALPLQTLSFTAAVLTFVIHTQHVSSTDSEAGAARAVELLEVAMLAVRRAEDAKSALFDAPTTMEGGLLEEVYLSSAMARARTEDVLVAVLGCQLMASVLWTTASLAGQRWAAQSPARASELEGFLPRAVGLLLQISIHNPTVTTGNDAVPSSALYDYAVTGSSGREHGGGGGGIVSHRARCGARYTPLGEAAVAALDACLTLHRCARLRCVSLEDVLPALPALSRCTRQSIHPPLRASVYRALTSLCSTPSQLLLVVQAMPSVVRVAVESVLACAETAAARGQWACAAAAEWLCAALRILSSASSSSSSSSSAADAGEVEWQHFDFTHTDLPRCVLQRAAGCAVGYTAAALLELCAELAEQERRRSRREDRHEKRATSAAAASLTAPELTALAPQGQRSMHCWLTLMRSTTSVNEKLSHFARLPLWAKAHPPAADSARSPVALAGDGAAAQGGCSTPASASSAPPIGREETTRATPPPLLSQPPFAPPQRQTAVPLCDAPTRALATLETVSTQYACTAAVLRCLTALLGDTTTEESSSRSRSRSDGGVRASWQGSCRALLTHSVVYGLLASVLAAPTPAAVLSVLSKRFGVLLDLSHAALARAHDAMVQWACELALVWFRPSSVVTADELHTHGAEWADVYVWDEFPPLPDAMLRDVCRLMEDDSVSQRTRCHLPLLLSSVLVLPSERVTATGVLRSAMHQSICAHGRRLLEASRRLRRLTCVSGLQCRLVRTCEGANTYAVEGDWLTSRTQELSKLTSALVENSGVLDEYDTESFLVTLSLVTSAIANSSCPSLPRETRQEFCAAVLEGLRYAATRHAAMQAVQAISASVEGQRCLLHEIASCGDPLDRSCFGRVVALSFGIPTTGARDQPVPPTRSGASSRRQGPAGVQQTVTWSPATAPCAYSGARRNRDGSTAIATLLPSPALAGCAAAAAAPRKDAAARAVAGLGFELLITVCGTGGHAFVAAFQKHNGLDLTEKLFLAYDRQQRWPTDAPGGSGAAAAASDTCPVPLPLLRLVAALSFDSAAQTAIGDRQALLTILIEVAGTADVAGSLALLTLRNLCFNTSLKSALSKDLRVLMTLKAALMGLMSVESLVVDCDASPAPVRARRYHSAGVAAVEGQRRGDTARGSSTTKTTGPSREFVALRRDITDERNTALTDWATRVAQRVVREKQRALLPARPSADKRQASPAGPGKQLGHSINNSPSVHSVGRPSSQARAEGELDDDDERLASGAQRRQPHVTSAQPERLAEMCEPSTAETFRRQELAVSALWALVYDHHRGRVYIKRVLRQEPSVDVSTLFPPHAVWGVRGVQDERGTAPLQGGSPQTDDGEVRAAGHKLSRHAREVQSVTDGVRALQLLDGGAQ